MFRLRWAAAYRSVSCPAFPTKMLLQAKGTLDARPAETLELKATTRLPHAGQKVQRVELLLSSWPSGVPLGHARCRCRALPLSDLPRLSGLFFPVRFIPIMSIDPRAP